MKIKNMMKYTGLAALVLTVAVGCASTPKEETVAQSNCTEAQNAVNEAKLAIQKANAEGALWRDTEDMVGQAEAAIKAGDCDKAAKLAADARRQAETALAQHQAEMAKMAASKSADSNYTVSRGDSLWGISGKGEVYGNPYQWPLIYKANRDKIKDADLIYPGQVFAINRSASEADIAAAVKHAKTRGAWSVGAVEESDKAYLAK